MTLPFPLIERLVAAITLALLLVFAITRNPLWVHIPELPGALSNTLVVFLALATLLTLGSLIPRAPLTIPGIVTALVLGYATYPWSLVRWERLIIRAFTGLETELVVPEPPGLLDWTAFVAPVLLLALLPVILQIRAITQRYLEKGATGHEVEAVRRRLLQEAALIGAITMAAVLLLGALLHLAAGRIPAAESLRDNPLLTLLVVTMLLLTALAIGTGALKKPRPRASPDSKDPNEQA
jgi:hypothetical protein